MQAAIERDLSEIRQFVEHGGNINERCDDGASVLFCVCMAGDLDFVRFLLDSGADPNLQAEDPAMGWYAPTVLDLMLSAQALMSWDKYTPVVELLLDRGARLMGGEIWNLTQEDQRERKNRCLDWQRIRVE